MKRQQIRDIALRNGFKLKPQADGREDLNEYVYTTIQEIIDIVREEHVILLDAIRIAARVGMKADKVERREDLVLANPTIQRGPEGELVAVTLQDYDDTEKTLALLWER